MAIAQVVAGARILISDLNAYYSLLKGSAGEAVTLIYNAAGSLIFQPSSDPTSSTQLIQIKKNDGTVRVAFTAGGQVLYAKGADIASAGTTDLSAATGNYVVVTGTTTITALGTVQAGTVMVLEFSGILTLTHNATSLILRAGSSATTAAGDVYTFVSEGSGNWREISHLTTTSGGGTTTRYLYLTAGSWGSVTGTPTYGDATATNAFAIGWELDAAATERVATTFMVPDDWASGALTYKLFFFAETATSGNVRFQTRALARQDGESVDTTNDMDQSDTVAVPGTAETLKVGTVGATHTVSAGDEVQIDVARIGGDGADTAAGDICLIGVKVEYTSNLT